MINFQNVSFSYVNNYIFENINYSFSNGRIYRIIGGNGVGKTTLLKLIYGNLIVSGGKIFRDEKLSEIDYLSNSLRLDENLSMDDHIRFIQSAYEIDDNELLNKMIILKKLKIDLFLNYYVSDLSLGTQKKLMFFLSYLRGFKILLLDELFSGIDDNGIKVISNILTKSAINGGIIIFVTHQDMESKYLKYTSIDLENE
ncbi:MAG: ATP-binding cassette domain-containing protein [Lactobacillaceae bacterium]|jgi:ABC-type multidrug transport system ATPase subunit|nr:ATP-binding cassette domain-containing protein [Lactobacillaceae bacterium]